MYRKQITTKNQSTQILLDALTKSILNFLEILLNFNHRCINPLSANPTKWSNTFKQFVSCYRQIV